MLEADVLIVGGGLVGASLGAALGSHPLARGMKVLIVEPNPPETTTWPPIGVRTSTILPSSQRFLEEIGAWEHLRAERIAAFDQMYVWDDPQGVERGGGGGELGGMFFESGSVGEGVLGVVVENESLRGAVYRRIEGLEKEGRGVSVIRGGVRGIGFGDVTQGMVGWPTVELDDGGTVKCRLIAACDGSGSRVRTMAGGDWFGKGYGEWAVVSNVALREEIRCAYQRFVSTGPVALLPLATEETGRGMGNLVWTTTAVEAEGLCAMDEMGFLNEVNVVLRGEEEDGARQGGLLGSVIGGVGGMLGSQERAPLREIPECVSVLGARQRFPLRIGHAPRYVLEDRRVVLVGDAAHSVHPMAGQGVNLGFADAETLTECVVGAWAVGRDVGGEAGVPLMRYQRERMVANLGMMGLLHGLHAGFQVGDAWGGRQIRRLGMSMVNAASPVKRLILRAMR